MTHADSLPVYFATQGTPPLSGLALARLDLASGHLTTPMLAAQTPDPSFIAVDSKRRHLYVCNSQTPGGVSGFRIHDTGALSFINYKSVAGRGPSHVSIDKTGRYVLNANYGGGYVEVIAADADGQLKLQSAFVQHTGSSVHPERQTKPYAHWFGVSPDNRFALATDLGTDRIAVYRFDDSSGALQPNDPPFIATPAGTGPRHIAWHPNARQFYLIQELANTITLYDWDDRAGTADSRQTHSTLPTGFSGANGAAEIAVHPTGRFLYASNRGDDSIARFALETDGRMSLQGHTPSRGKTPRYFAIDPTGRWMIVANQASDGLVVFGIDQDSGSLQAAGEPVTLAKPGGIAFFCAPAR
jgi:6-phosphogluconolactonase